MRAGLAKLDAYRPMIEARFAAYPELSGRAAPRGIRAAGYAGGYTQLKDLVRQLRPVPEPQPVIRFETPAGHRAQVEFACFRFSWGVRYVLLVVLGSSRPLQYRFYPRQDCGRLWTASKRRSGTSRASRASCSSIR